MPLHKSSSKAHRLDPTMISAPLGDFRHTMHIGRGGDAFGDTSFLSTVGPSPTTSELSSSGISPVAEPGVSVNNGSLRSASFSGGSQLKHSDSESDSFTLDLDLDLDLDLGPSMLGDVLGVMDGVAPDSNVDNVFSPLREIPAAETKQVRRGMEMSVNELNENQAEDIRTPDENGFKPRAPRPKVRFSDKREEIIRQASEEEEGQTFDFQSNNQVACHSPVRGESDRRKGEPELTNHRADLPPSPASSHSSEYEGVAPLDRRRSESSETDSEEEEEGTGRGYTFEDEFDDDDEIVV
ncbi:cdc42 effector protein 5 [Austrofundulus limnaeus]|uniref:Cdc42 effector protein 5 n=1 Tax=Austrofundulus limnaeus TaxID=52670 RepID=A0A2I4D1S1_AUSLI|nr:PREDICTED: cdc42 effector protein 5 [Austrofundulus limnaeus]XP_013886179.1 PREDICTED: cdc42 effector protein 5 [Austrofundulus limnaeus]